MTKRSALWIIALRPYEGEFVVDAVMSLKEQISKLEWLELRIRLNPDIRMVVLWLPTGTKREQVTIAFGLLNRVEQRKLYELPLKRAV